MYETENDMKRLRWLLTAAILITITMLTTTALGSSRDVYNAAVLCDELNSVTALGWTCAQNDGTFAYSTMAADCQLNMDNSNTSGASLPGSVWGQFIVATTVVLKNSDYALLMGFDGTAAGTSPGNAAEWRTTDAVGVHFAAVVLNDGQTNEKAAKKKVTNKKIDENKVNETSVIRV